jgi:hypothetical protein
MSAGSLVIPIQEVRCPYCRHINRISLKSSYEREVVCCDPETGGCEQYFFIAASAKVVTLVDAWRIDGFENVEPAPKNEYVVEPDMRRLYL